MLFPARSWPGLRDGTVTVAFRRWRRPTVRESGTLLSPGGLLGIDEVEVVDPEGITQEDAVAAGHRSPEEVLAALRPDGDLYRIRFHRIGDDPRLALRQQADLEADELEALRRRLDRLDWAAPVLRAMADRPATVSTELAAALGVDRPVFKQRVRRLKALGLTESLETGYRLSPRGQTVLDHL